MEIDTSITGADLLSLTSRVEAYNKSLNPGKVKSEELDRDQFLRLLLTQLTHQDPTEPLEDKEFIAQMAQFSTLEQMTNMNTELTRLFGLIAKSQAVALLGKTVQIMNGEQPLTGTVEEVTGSEFPQVLVGGQYYDALQIVSVKE
jgi:flagellar basal-body rod modification protein FlgD